MSREGPIRVSMGEGRSVPALLRLPRGFGCRGVGNPPRVELPGDLGGELESSSLSLTLVNGAGLPGD